MKDDLLRTGYLPENLPPAFTTAPAAVYNGSKRGLTRRTFSAVHPATAHDMAEFVSSRWNDIQEFFSQGNASYSVPKIDENADRALVINPHIALEEEKVRQLSAYRFVAATDIARFYHSIYTHSIPWAYHGKAASKQDRRVQSANIFFNRADAILRSGQDGQTVGIPVGPDTSRVFAEIIGTAIDLEFENRNLHDRVDCKVLRHVDDVWIGANSHADAERALSRYREAIREFELDINENKTRIFSEDFTFSDFWPSELSRQIEFATNSSGRRAKELLRSALENSFSMAVSNSDDGILKYILRYIDQHELSLNFWEVIEPFLKRVAVHFGHTIDYVSRILVWRHLAQGDLNTASWDPILSTILDKHGRLGNDSEVCWTIYAIHHLNITVSNENASRIVRNCGALSITALLNCVELGLVDSCIFTEADKRINTENDAGRYWPVFLEWKTKRWKGHSRIGLTNRIMTDLIKNNSYIYDANILPAVFHNIEKDKFGTVSFAIEQMSSLYDEEFEDNEEDDDEPF